MIFDNIRKSIRNLHVAAICFFLFSAIYHPGSLLLNTSRLDFFSFTVGTVWGQGTPASRWGHGLSSPRILDVCSSWAAPFVSDLNNPTTIMHLQHFRSDKRHNCSSFALIIKLVGINGAMTLIPAMEWHRLSQVYCNLVSTEASDDLSTAISLLGCYAQTMYAYTGHPKSNGIVHGAVWFLVWAREGTIDWDDILQWLPLISNERYGHGIGHGLHFKFVRDELMLPVDECSFPPFGQSLPVSAWEAALRVCQSCPYDFLRLSCAEGLYHNWFEREHMEPLQLLDPLYPCDNYDMSYPCFVWLFAGGKGYQVPHYNLSQLYRNWSGRSICTGLQDSSHAVACIAGFASVNFLFYHQAAVNLDRRSIMQACLEVPWFFAPPLSSCQLLFANDNYRGIISTRSGTLVNWCSSLVDRHTWIGDDHDQLKWLACVFGSLAFPAQILNAHNQTLPADLLSHWCDSLLHVTWQSKRIRQEAARICHRYMLNYPLGLAYNSSLLQQIFPAGII